jgi:hypothetical protein
MKVALAILCIGAVIFLLRVLAALAKEWMSLRRGENESSLCEVQSSPNAGRTHRNEF